MAVTSVAPLPTADTSPAASTVATDSSTAAQANSAPATRCSLASNASAERRTVSPNAIRASEAGVTFSATATCSTVTRARPVTDAAVAVTSVAPLPTAVTSPASFTVATAPFPAAQANSVPATRCPLASNASAERRTVSPKATRVSGVGVTSMAATCCLTVMRARAATEPAVAVTSVAPLPTADTSPAASTVATDSSTAAQANSAPATRCSLASNASAERRTVSPNAIRASEAGVTFSATATCPTVTCALPVTVPAVAVTSVAPLPTAVTSPASSTVATDLFPAAQVNSVPATRCPLASNASAERRTVSPKATRVSGTGGISTAATVWSTVTSALPLAIAAEAVMRAAPFDTDVTIPSALTVATAESLLAQVRAAPAITCPSWSLTVAFSWALPPSTLSATVRGSSVTVVGTRGGGSVGVESHAVSTKAHRNCPTIVRPCFHPVIAVRSHPTVRTGWALPWVLRASCLLSTVASLAGVRSGHDPAFLAERRARLDQMCRTSPSRVIQIDPKTTIRLRRERCYITDYNSR